MVSAKCSAPPSSRSSRVTDVTTMCRNPIRFAVSATARGSSGDGGAYGRPVVTLQKPQERVQTSPRIMKVAVPRAKHSVRFGQASDSQTECSDFSRSSDLTSCSCCRFRRFSRIHSGRRGEVIDAKVPQTKRPPGGGRQRGRWRVLVPDAEALVERLLDELFGFHLVDALPHRDLRA